VILVISYPGEEHTADVVSRLEAQGREVVQVDLSDFPARAGLGLTWDNGRAPSYVVDTPKGASEISRASVGWWRRIRSFTVDGAVVNRNAVAFAHSETAQAVNGMLDAIGCPWVNPREADAAAHHKPYQWAVARRVGLRLARTLVTNKPDAARAFISSVGVGRTVFKAFLASIEEWRETRLVEPGDLDRLDLVRYAPVIFQEYVPGVDLRVTVVGQSVFAAEIDARQTTYPVDMRMVVGQAAVRAVKLPAKVERKLLKLLAELNLVYGAIDLRRTEGGDFVFLEVNPAGQWQFVEQRTGLPIAQAMADYLAGLDDAGRGEKGDG
jgi:glutathione synthase/RimK-type ligase-like ATP-grasp enzyme